jgi:MFS family permease
MNNKSSATIAAATGMPPFIGHLAANLAGIDARRLFIIGNLSIFMIGLGFAVRANIAGDIQLDLFNEIDLARSGAMIGAVLGSTFIGFALTLLFGSALVDHLGMKRMLLFSAMGYIIGSAVVVYASFMAPGDATYWMIYAGFLLTGLGWGAVEAASNPLVAALYPDEKTHRINVLHAWWPAGIVIGGLIGLGLGDRGHDVHRDHGTGARTVGGSVAD